ncbi:MAG: LCP family protein [Clostridia bacterium]|nr:LCP family protein [Clostridia bacterium]
MARQYQKKNIFQRFKRLSKKKKVIFILVLVVILLVAAAGGYAISKLNKMDRVSVDTTKLSIVDVDGYANILLLGVDTRDMKHIDGSRSDAIMVVSINTKTKEVNLISLYRDTYLRMGDRGSYDKITHACAFGGPELSCQAINQALDLNISNYVVVNFKAVADLVDAVGGITVDVKDIEISQLNKYTKQTAKNIGRKDYSLVKEPGKQKLCGVQAVAYGRIRKGVGDDYERTHRMRRVLTKVFKKMKEMPLSKLDDIADMMLPQVKTTLSNSDILALSVRLNSYKIMGSTGFPFSVTSGNIGGVSYVIPTDLAGDVERLHKERFGQEDYTPSETVRTISSGISSTSLDKDKKKEKKKTTVTKKKEEPQKQEVTKEEEPVKEETPTQEIQEEE